MSFFYIALEEIEDSKKEHIQNQSIAHRGSKADKFEDFLKLFDKQTKKHEAENHATNISMLNKKL